MGEIEVIFSRSLPSDVQEATSCGPDGAPFDGLSPTPGLPLATAARPDVEPGLTERDRIAVIDEAQRITARAAGSPVMHISSAGLALIEAFEGFSPTIYHDSVGVPTVGYGTTSADVFPLPTHLTREQAQALLAREVAEKYEPAVRSIGVPLNQHQFDALCSFVYNLGPGAVSSSWTIGRLLRERDYIGAANSMLMYDHAGGMVLQGLLTRREEERKLFLTPVPPAPDPHNILWFYNKTWLIDAHRINERATVAKWWDLQGNREKNHTELVHLQHEIVLLRKRVWAVAHHDHPASWGVDHRGMRWHDLNQISSVHL